MARDDMDRERDATDGGALLPSTRGLHSLQFPLILSLVYHFPLNLSSLCPLHNPN